MLYKEINLLAQEQWLWVDKMGWHNKLPLEYVALIASEIGEVANECRGEQPTEKLGEELADIILRTLDMGHQFGFNMSAEIQAKMIKNYNNGTRGRLK